MRRAAMPPTTPPTIAPVLEDFLPLGPEPAVCEGDELEVLEDVEPPVVVCGLELFKQLLVELLPTPRKSLLAANLPLLSCGANNTVIPTPMLAVQLYESVAVEGMAMSNAVPSGMSP
jgi:hypothetical protein